MVCNASGLGNAVFLWRKRRIAVSDFASLSSENTLQEVRKMAPFGAYLFLHAGRNDLPMVSSHYLTDGYLIQITYDEETYKDYRDRKESDLTLENDNQLGGRL